MSCRADRAGSRWSYPTTVAQRTCSLRAPSVLWSSASGRHSWRRPPLHCAMAKQVLLRRALRPRAEQHQLSRIECRNHPVAIEIAPRATVAGRNRQVSIQ
jgi:hypothetical protein